MPYSGGSPYPRMDEIKGLTQFLSILIIPQNIPDSFVSLGIFDDEGHNKTLSLLNCALVKSCISVKQN